MNSPSPASNSRNSALQIVAVSERATGIRGLRTAVKQLPDPAQVAVLKPADITRESTLGGGLIVLQDSARHDAVALLPVIRQRFPGSPVVVVTERDDCRRLKEVLDAGADDCLSAEQVQCGLLPYALQRAAAKLPAPASNGTAPLSAEQQLRAVVNSAPMVLLALDPQGTITAYEGQGVVARGRKPGELVGHSIWEVAGMRPELEILARRALAGERFTAEVQDSEIYYRIAFSPQHDAEGNFSGTVVVASDITDHVRADRAIYEANERLEREVAERTAELREKAELLDQASDAIIMCDLNGRVVYWNQGASEIYGYSPEEARGQILQELLKTEFPQPLPQIIAEVLREGEYEGELVQTTKEGERLVIWSRWSLRRDEHGEPAAILQSNRDITARKRAESVLREQGELLDMAHDAVLICDEDDRILYWNLGAQRTYGWRRKEVEGQLAHQLLKTRFPVSFEKVKETIFHAGSFEGELQHTTRDGRRLMIASRWAAHVSDTGQRTYMQINRDVTVQRRAEVALQESEARFRQLADAMPQLIWTADPDGRVDYYNERRHEYTGFSQGEDGSFAWSPVLHEDDVQPTLEAWQRALQTGSTYQIEHRVKMARGGYRWHLSRGVPARDEQGRIHKWFGTATDIDEWKRAEEALARSEARLRATFDQAGVGIVEVDQQDRFVAVNDRVCEILGYARDELLGMTVHELTYPEDREISDAMNRRLHEGEFDRFTYEKRYLKRDGTPLWVNVTVGAVRDSAGRQLRSIATVEDITERKQAEEALRKSERQFRTLIENLTSGVALVDETGAFTLVNQAFLQLFGFAEDSAVSNVNDRDWAAWKVFGEDGKLLDVDDHPVRKAALTLQPVHNQMVGVQSPGRTELVWMLVSAEPLLKPDGRLDQMICHYLDITGRKEVEAKLAERARELNLLNTELGEANAKLKEEIRERRRAEDALRRAMRDTERHRAQLEAVFESVEDGVVVCDMQGRFLLVNESEARINGYENAAAMTRDIAYFSSVYELCLPDGTELPLEDWPVSKVLRGETVSNWELKGRRKDTGRAWYFSFSGAPVVNDLGEQILAVVVTRDITERKRTEQAVREAAEQRRLALEAANLGTWSVDLQSGGGSWDERCQELFGMPGRGQVAIEEFQAVVHAEDRDALTNAVERATAPFSDGCFEAEYRILLPGQDVRWISSKGQAFFEDDRGERQAVRLVGTAQDITQRKLAEEQIQRYSEELEQLVAVRTEQVKVLEQHRLESEKQVAIGRMAARIAHEINNPLAGVKNSFLLVKRAIPTDFQYYDFVGRIEREIERIARIVRQMFELYKPEQKVASLVHPEHVIHDVAELLQGNSRAQGVTVQIEASRVQEPVHVHEDSLRQVLFSVIQNAIEASRAGGVVRINAETTEHQLKIAISDEGEGIPPEVGDKIFEPFFTTKSGLTTGGLGLGLSITRGLVQAMGGELSFKSEPGQGTTFCLTLPLP